MAQKEPLPVNADIGEETVRRYKCRAEKAAAVFIEHAIPAVAAAEAFKKAYLRHIVCGIGAYKNLGIIGKNMLGKLHLHIDKAHRALRFRLKGDAAGAAAGTILPRKVCARINILKAGLPVLKG